MSSNNPPMSARPFRCSETTVLLFSFVTAFAIGIVVITAVFVTVRKIESRFFTASAVPSAVEKRI